MRRLDLDDPNVWDRWRELYYELTHEENIEFGNAIEARYPSQQSYTVSNFDRLFTNVYGVKVLEIGGWKGELARRCISLYSIDTWHNIDMCSAAVLKGLKHPKYKATFPDRFDWFTSFRDEQYDICISAHTIEHFSDDHLRMLISYLVGIKTIMFEAPISMDMNDWTGYEGTHMLKMGWKAVNQIMVNHGYSVEKINEHCFLYQR